MGYRSEVVISMRISDFADMYMSAKESNEGAANLMEVADKFIIKYDDIINIRWSDIKWYTSYGDVAFIVNYIKSIPHAIRIVGEDFCDTTNEINCDYYDEDVWEALYEAAQIDRSIIVSGVQDQEYLAKFLHPITKSAASKDEISDLLA